MDTKYKFRFILLSIFVALCIFWSPSKVSATTYTAADCTEASFQSIYATEQASKADGDIIVIPAGGAAGACTWSSAENISPTNSLTIQGSTTCTGTPASSCTDNTIITDGVSHSPTDTATFLITTASGKFLRLTGITFQGSGSTGTTFQGMVRIAGGSTTVRIDHCHFNLINNTAFMIIDVYGVMDHSIVTMNGVNQNGMKIRKPGGGIGAGDAVWNQPTQFGTVNFFFVEDSTITSGFGNDCEFGGRYVFRHNNMLLGAGMQEHGTGSGGPDERGCRAFEAYQNTMTGLPACSGACFTAGYMMSGTGLFWGNSVDSNFQHVMVLHSIRRSNAEYTQSATPGGWGYCGTSFNGTGSNWDQNSNTTNGYACLDSLGRGQGDLLSGAAPNKVNSSNGNVLTWPRQSLEPMYMWLNAWTGSPATAYTAFTENVNPNQDVYDWCNPSSANGCTSFNGTVGVGSGLLSARPSTCSPNPISYSGPYTGAPLGSSPGVGYWATDTNTLYVCTAANTWTSYYTPYTYPHPLSTATFTYVQDSLRTGCSGTASSCVIQPGNMFPTVSGSVWVVLIQTPANVTISAVCGTTNGNTCTGTNDGWTKCPNCHLFSAAIPDNVDMWYSTTGPAGTNAVNVTLSGAAGGFFSLNFIELSPPTGATASYDASGTTVSTTCSSSCQGVALTLSGTDAIIQGLHDNGVVSSTAFSTPYITDQQSNGIALAATSGAAPTIVLPTTGEIVSAIAFTTNLGSFTPASTPISLVSDYNGYYHNNANANVSCTPNCTLAIHSTTAGNMLVAVQGGTTNITSVSCAPVSCTSPTWQIPSGANTCAISGATYSMNCAYLLSAPAGVRSLTFGMSGSATEVFEVWELNNSTTGTWSLDTQKSQTNVASLSPPAVQMTLNGSQDAIFQLFIEPGGSSSISYYPYPAPSVNFGGQPPPGNSNVNLGILLNTNTSNAPLWTNNQNNVTYASAIAFMAGASGTGTAPAVSFAPASVAFMNQIFLTPSSPQVVTLTNTGAATLNISSITFTGTNPSAFSEFDNCPATLGVGASCIIQVAFTPQQNGALAANLTVTDTPNNVSGNLPLSGMGVLPALPRIGRGSVIFAQEKTE